MTGKLLRSSIERTDEELWELQLEREQTDAHVTSYAGRLPGGAEASEIYARLLAAEENLAPNGDYVQGSAKVKDEVLVLHGLSRVLLTAEHATIQMRNGAPKEADMGTGALGEVVAQDTNSTAVIAIGRQTSDPNHDVDHILKATMADILRSDENRAHLSLHMLNRGRATHPQDKRGYSIMLGIGKEPSEATLAMKDFLLGIAEDLELRAGVNKPHINFDENRQLILRDDGTLRRVIFAGAGPGTTRTFSQNMVKALGKDDAFAAIQLEINEVLMAKQNDKVGFPDQTDRELGSYLGYLFVKGATESVTKL